MKNLGILLSLLIVGCYAENRRNLIKHNVKRSSQNSPMTYLPTSNSGPTEVEVTIWFLDLAKVDIKNMEYTLQMYFRQSWKDTRLPSYITKELGRPRASKWVFNDLELIWKPDLFLVEDRRDEVHDVLVPNSFLRVEDDGKVLWSKRITPTMSCNMDFRAFPHDKQNCSFNIESYGYNASQLDLKWGKSSPGFGSVGITEHANESVADYIVLPLKWSKKYESLTFGNYSRLYIDILFQRKIGFFLTKFYLPYIFLVLIASLTFWIDPKIIWARLALLFSVLLIMVALAFEMNCYIPVTSYTKAIDIWVGFCLTFTFAALLEYIFVYYIQNQRAKTANEETKNDPELLVPESETVRKDKDLEIEVNASTTKFVAHSLRKVHQWSTHTDKIFRYLYPMLFAVFNLIYWCAYAS